MYTIKIELDFKVYYWLFNFLGLRLHKNSKKRIKNINFLGLRLHNKSKKKDYNKESL